MNHDDESPPELSPIILPAVFGRYLWDWLLTAALALVAMAGVGAFVLFVFSLDRIVP